MVRYNTFLQRWEARPGLRSHWIQVTKKEADYLFEQGYIACAYK